MLNVQVSQLKYGSFCHMSKVQVRASTGIHAKLGLRVYGIICCCDLLELENL